jgi:mannose-1-phosphate guanylyltransferase
MPSPHLFAVILAGGSGTRFWPASRAARPKQFLPIVGGRPMIEETRERLRGLVADEDVLVVTAAEQVELVREALPDLPPENVVAEPEARNTAAAVALSALVVARRDPSAVQIVLPADHVIEPAASFRRTLAAAAEAASSEDCLVTLGIQPDHPATGYGYIEVGAALGERDGIPVREVARFVEKPDLETAVEFLASGRFLWNAGIFVWSTPAILAALARHAPDVHEPLAAAGESELARAYARVPRRPIDVAVLEKADNVRCLPLRMRAAIAPCSRTVRAW